MLTIFCFSYVSLVTAFEKRKDKQDNSNNSTGGECTTLSSTKDAMTTDLEATISSATSSPPMMITSRTISVDDNVDTVAISHTEENSSTGINNQAAILKRYKIERKNSQQSSHSKMVIEILNNWTNYPILLRYLLILNCNIIFPIRS